MSTHNHQRWPKSNSQESSGKPDGCKRLASHHCKLTQSEPVRLPSIDINIQYFTYLWLLYLVLPNHTQFMLTKGLDNFVVFGKYLSFCSFLFWVTMFEIISCFVHKWYGDLGWTEGNNLNFCWLLVVLLRKVLAVLGVLDFCVRF